MFVRILSNTKILYVYDYQTLLLQHYHTKLMLWSVVQISPRSLHSAGDSVSVIDSYSKNTITCIRRRTTDGNLLAETTV